MTLPISSLLLSELITRDGAFQLQSKDNTSQTVTVSSIPADLEHIKGPILGYFGTLDEQIDYDLIHALAVTRPEWHIVLVGQKTSVDTEHLSYFTNIHWLGERSYKTLPHYAAAFDVCLMPFLPKNVTAGTTDNLALHYIAAGKPVVSTCAAGEAYADMIQVADSLYDFLDNCDHAVRALSM